MNNEIYLGDLLCAYFRPLEDYMTGDSIYDDTGLSLRQGFKTFKQEDYIS